MLAKFQSFLVAFQGIGNCPRHAALLAALDARLGHLVGKVHGSGKLCAAQGSGGKGYARKLVAALRHHAKHNIVGKPGFGIVVAGVMKDRKAKCGTYYEG